MANMDLNPQEAAALGGLSERTLRAMLKDGRLTGRKKDGRWRIRQSDLPLTEAARARLNALGFGITRNDRRVFARAHHRVTQRVHAALAGRPAPDIQASLASAAGLLSF